MELQLNPFYTQSEEWEHLDRLLIWTKSGKRYRLVKERKGHWEEGEGDWLPCSNCHHYWIQRGEQYDFDFCPKCGADMRGVTE